MDSQKCPSCQAPLPADPPAGLCPACVLRAAHETSSPLPDAPPVAEIQDAFPDLQIESIIGRGGMGIVYKAFQPHLDRNVALKILAPDLGSDPGFSERFIREARTLGKLSHPNIVAIHDFGQTGDYFWLLMEFVEGVNLHQAMRAERFTPQQALAVIPEICRAVGFAHERGVLHRDIKPENILLDTAGHVKIADFGIARFTGESDQAPLTCTGSMLGSAAYMAPEQLESPRDVDHRADIYSIGVIFYQMLTGTLPLGRFPPPSEQSTADPALDAVVFKALEREREQRFQSTSDVTECITAASGAAPAGRPGFSPLPTTPNRFLYASLGLLLGGATTIAAGAYTSQFLLGLGLSAAPLGLVGCLIVLHRSARGQIQISRGSRHLLTFLALAPLVVAAPYFATIGFYVINEGQARDGAGQAELVWLQLICLLAILVPVPLVRLAARLFIPALDPDHAPAKTRLWVLATALALATLGVATAKFEIVQRPLISGYMSQGIHVFNKDKTPLPDQDLAAVREAMTEAAGPFAEHYRIRHHPGARPQNGFYPGPVFSLELVAGGTNLAREHTTRFFDSLYHSLPDHLTAKADKFRPPLPWSESLVNVITMTGFVLTPLATLLTVFLTRRRTVTFAATVTALTAAACLIGRNPAPFDFPVPLGDTPPPPLHTAVEK